MCGCRSLLRRACPPPPHIKKAFEKWYKVTRRALKGHGTWVYDPLHPDPLPPSQGGRECREWGDVIPFAVKNLLNGERDILTASSAGGGPTKSHQLAFRNPLH
jgi:hypothetical protein